MTTATDATGFRGATVVIFESRMAEVMAESLTSCGVMPLSARSI